MKCLPTSAAAIGYRGRSVTPSRDTRKACQQFSLRNMTTVARYSRTAELISTKPSVVIRVANGIVLGRIDVGPRQKESQKVHVSEPIGCWRAGGGGASSHVNF